jgi:hypothetical protein
MAAADYEGRSLEDLAERIKGEEMRFYEDGQSYWWGLRRGWVRGGHFSRCSCG